MIIDYMKTPEHLELYRKAEALLRKHDDGPLYTEGVLIYSRAKVGEVGVVAADHMWGVSLGEVPVLTVVLTSGESQGLKPGFEVEEALVRMTIDEIDRLMVLDRLAEA